jgi:hypothetical protein
LIAAAWRRERPARSRQRLIGAAVKGQIGIETLGPALDRLLLLRERRIRRWHQLSEHFARNFERLAEGWNTCQEMPEQDRGEDYEQEARDNRQIDLNIKPLHQA